ncbi:hypothetical protein G4228_013605 [Cervus hanglu yarkandensis]|nr:hypothetical protein G4228_013605 [Cervus hanglu yarkandensis]
MAKAGDKSGGSGKKGLKRKAAPEAAQEAAVGEDGTTESGVQPPTTAAFPPGFSISEIKNKQRRHLMFTRWKQQQRKEKLAAKKKLKKEREALGDKAPPKPVPKTIDNQRVYDETIVDPNDEEVAYDEATDEFASYFNRQTSPKILITTSDRPHGRTVRLCEQLSTVIPNSHVYYRRGLALKKIIPQCISRDFTDLIVINEDRKIPNGLILSHLPNGPTAHFKMSSVRLRKEIKRRGKDPTEHIPEIILNNFTTRLGHSIGRMFASLFPHNPQFIGRQVATFHNQRDYIFFRFHRYIFKSEKKVGIQELGPRFTLKLRSLQKGTFDSKYGEYEWVHKYFLNIVNFLCYGWISASAGGKATPNENQIGNNQTGNPELPRSQEDSDNDYFSDSKSQFLWKNEDDRANIIRREDNQLGKTEYIPLPDLIDFPSLPCQPALSPGITDKSLSQIETCSVWKKKCFETKKVTASLEEVLTKLREDLELYYKKLLMQLEAREIKMRPKNLANITDSKNYLIIQITEVQHAIDQLKRKLDTDKMKLIIEIKMRKQAISDLRTMKAELAQRKLNTTFQSQLGMLI